MSGDNTHSGGASIIGGTLQSGDGQSPGSLVGDIDTGADATNQGVPAINRSRAQEIARAMMNQ